MKALALVLLLLLSACKEVQVEEEFHYVYLNWAEEDTATTMQINIATTRNHPKWVLNYRLVGESSYQNMVLESVEDDYLRGAFFLHFPIKNLVGGGKYEFFVETENYTGPTYRFSTIAKDSSHVRFVVGGDTGTGRKFQKMAAAASQVDFDFAVFGGDIAYANGDLDNYKMWLSWLDTWTAASNHDGELKPFITAIGNHETNHFLFFLPGKYKAPFYYSLFQQDEKSYFRREVAGQNFLILDTGHVATYGSQKDFVSNNTYPNKNIFQFSFYHIPFFPAHRSFKGQARAGRKAWMSRMQDGGIDVSFEHHDHVLKRTYPLKDLEVNRTEGIIYLGDGAMGKSTRELNNEWYLEEASEENHFWMVDMYDQKAEFRAVGFKGVTLDYFEKQK